MTTQGEGAASGEVEALVGRYDPASPDFDLYRAMRTACPVANVGGVWVLTRYADVTAVSRDDDTFASGPAFGYPDGFPDDEVAHGPTRTPMTIPMMLDPPLFWKYRRVLNPMFTPSRAKEREADVRQLAISLVDRFAAEGVAEFHRDFAIPLPAIVTCRLLGVPEDEWEFFATPVHKMLHDRDEGAVAGQPRDVAEGEDPLGLSWDLLFPTVQAMIDIAHDRRGKSGEDVLTYLANTEVDGRKLNDYEIGGIAILVVIGGVDTTTGAIGSALVHLGRNPEDRRRLASNPSLIPDAVEEFLRVYSPVQALPRVCTQDTEVGGTKIAAGDFLMLNWGSANRDPTMFPDPDQVDIERAVNRHVTFGTGIHRCLGSHLARIEFTVGLEELLRRIPDYELDEAGIMLQPNAQIYGYQRIPATFPVGRA